MNEIQERPAVPVAALVYQPGVTVAVPMGHELWEDRSRHLLRLRFRQACERGEVEAASGWRTAPNGAAAVVVKRLRQPRSPVPLYIAGAATAMSTVVGAGIMLWQSRYIWLALAGVALLTVGIVRLLGNHSGACVGLHCAGCRG